MTIASRAVGSLVLYAAAYGGSVVVLRDAPDFEAGEALAVVLIFGLGFSVAAWLTTAQAAPAQVDVRAPAHELGVLCAYLVLFAVLFLGWGLSVLKATRKASTWRTGLPRRRIRLVTFHRVVPRIRPFPPIQPIPAWFTPRPPPPLA